MTPSMTGSFVHKSSDPRVPARTIINGSSVIFTAHSVNSLLKDINFEEIKSIENRLNNRRRQRLEFRMPAEVVHQSLSRIAGRV